MCEHMKGGREEIAREAGEIKDGRWDVHWPVRDLGCHPDLFQLAVVEKQIVEGGWGVGMWVGSKLRS